MADAGGWGPPDWRTTEWTWWRVEIWVRMCTRTQQQWQRYGVFWIRYITDLAAKIREHETAGLYTQRRIYLQEWVWTEEDGWREKDHQ